MQVFILRAKDLNSLLRSSLHLPVQQLTDFVAYTATETVGLYFLEKWCR